MSAPIVSAPLFAVGWRPAEPPLAPVGVAARGAVARALALRLLAHDVAGLSGVAGAEVLVVLGAAAALPWADGCVYLGRHPDAPGLYFPTTWLPDAPLPLHARAVLARVPTEGAPVALLRAPDQLVPLGAARPLAHASLRAWLDGRRPGGAA